MLCELLNRWWQIEKVERESNIFFSLASQFSMYNIWNEHTILYGIHVDVGPVQLATSESSHCSAGVLVCHRHFITSTIPMHTCLYIFHSHRFVIKRYAWLCRGRRGKPTAARPHWKIPFRMFSMCCCRGVWLNDQSQCETKCVMFLSTFGRAIRIEQCWVLKAWAGH